MTVLNRPSDGLASVLLALHRAVVAFGPNSEPDLISLVAPPAMLADAKPEMARRTLTRWLQLGFFSGGKSEPIRLSDELEGLNPSDPQGVRSIFEKEQLDTAFCSKRGRSRVLWSI